MEPLVRIFNNSFFRIPYYQRGYSWTEKQISELWQDISNLLNHETRCHYMGMLGKEKIPKNEFIEIDGYNEREHEGMDFYFIVDGQQRFLTLAILIAVITENLNEQDNIGDTKSDIIKKYIKNKNLFILDYLKDDLSHEYLNDFIFQEKKYNDDHQTVYIGNLSDAKKFFSDELKKIENKFQNRKSFLEHLRKLYRIISNRLLFDNNNFEGNLEISMIFETMNSRGKSLSYLELLKNRLMYLSSSIALMEGNEDKEDLRKINNSWSIIYEFLGSIAKKESDSDIDNEFLSNHWVMYGNYDRKVAEFYKENIFNAIFKISRTGEEVVKEKPENPEDEESNEIQTITHYFVLKKLPRLKVDHIHHYRESLTESILYWSLIKNPFYDFSKLRRKRKIDEFEEKVDALIKKIEDCPEILVWLKKLNYIGFKAFRPILLCVFLREKNLDKIVDLLKAIERHIFLIFLVSHRKADTGTYRFFAWANRYFVNHEDYWHHFSDRTFMKTIDQIIDEVKYWVDGDENNGYLDLQNFYRYMNDQFSMEFSPRDGFKSWGQSKSLKYFLLEYEYWENPDCDLHYRDCDIAVIKEYLSKEDKEMFNNTRPVKKEEKDELLRKKRLEFTLGNLYLTSKKNLKTNKDINFKNWDEEKSKKRGIRLLKFMEERWNVQFKDWKVSYERMLFLD